MSTIYRPKIVSRADAQRAGAIHYYTGQPCRRGHLALRYVHSGHCGACQAGQRGASDQHDMRARSRVVKLRWSLNATDVQRADFADRLRALVLDAGGYVQIEKL